MTELMESLVKPLIMTVIFSTFGLVLFLIAFWAIVRMTPFSIRKELEQDQNVAIAVVIAAVIIGIALIVAAGVHG